MQRKWAIDDSGNYFRSYGNENWEFDEYGFMRQRIAGINELSISLQGTRDAESVMGNFW